MLEEAASSSYLYELLKAYNITNYPCPQMGITNDTESEWLSIGSPDLPYEASSFSEPSDLSVSNQTVERIHTRIAEIDKQIADGTMEIELLKVRCSAMEGSEGDIRHSCVAGSMPEVDSFFEPSDPNGSNRTVERIHARITEIEKLVADDKMEIEQLKVRCSALEVSGGDVRNTCAPGPIPKWIQAIYEQNRHKAGKSKSHTMLPIYNQPRDVPWLNEIRIRGEKVKACLEKRFRREEQEQKAHEEKWMKTYSALAAAWVPVAAERDEQLKSKETRVMFEEVFPVMKPKKVKKRSGKLMEKPNQRETMLRGSAVFPPMVDKRLRLNRYIDKNNRVEDMFAEGESNRVYWTMEEHALFKEMLAKHGKKFHLFRESLPNKRLVDHYYLTKQFENYKEIMPKERNAKSARSSRSVSTSSRDLPSVESPLSSSPDLANCSATLIQHLPFKKRRFDNLELLDTAECHEIESPVSFEAEIIVAPADIDSPNSSQAKAGPATKPEVAIPVPPAAVPEPQGYQGRLRKRFRGLNYHR